MEFVVKSDDWFSQQLEGLTCGSDTRAYIINVLIKHINPGYDDMSGESIVLAYANARSRGDFGSFQRLGDWTLWASAICPSIDAARQELIETIGSLSYFTCHRILLGKWGLYEELASDFPKIVRDLRSNLFIP